MTFTTALALFGLLSLIYLSLELLYTYAHLGFGHGFSSNRTTSPDHSALGIRINRSWQNQVESSAYIVPALALAAITGLESASAELAALLIIVGRAAFLPLYLTGVPFIRVPAWGLGTFGSLYIIYVLFTSGVL